MRKTTLKSNAARAQEQLDSLRDGSVVLDRFGDAWQAGSLYWYRAYGDSSFVSSYDLAQTGAPFTTIYAAPARAGLPVIGGRPA